MSKKQKKNLTRIVLSLLSFIPAVLFNDLWLLKILFFVVSYFIVGYDILNGAVRGLINRQPFDENFLMAVATVGAFALGEYAEGVFVMLFYQLGELLQSIAVGRSRKNIAELMDIRPDYANIKNDKGEIIKVSPREICIGDVFFVLPGEKIPLDGVVIGGESTLDTSSLTGETIPRKAAYGDRVLSGCINLKGMLEIKTEKEFEQSTASRILELVENASARKSRSERFISKFARIYTPAVCLSAVLLALVPPLLILWLYGDNTFRLWVYRALTFLVVSCPCALVVSVPLTFFAGLGGVGNRGILIKGANYIEALSKADTVVFDKTGTLTKGVFEIVDVICEKNTAPEMLLEYTVLAESFSNHPISESLKKSYKKTLDKSRVSCFTDMSGFGISAFIDNVSVLVGNSGLMENYKISYVPCKESGTAVYVAINGRYSGCILLSDVLKETSLEAVKQLKNNGVSRCVMLTGDRKEIGEKTAGLLRMDSVYTELLPAGKVDVIERLLSGEKNKRTLLFVGDGINDAPVLARADVGIAMGALGSDAAIEAADVVLMDDDPMKVVTAITMAKKCMSIVYQNIIFAITVKLLFLLLGALGIAGMWFAVFADVGVMVIAVLNAVRALKL